MSKERIKLKDNTMCIMVKMSDGNPGALNALMDILTNSEKIDPDGAMGGLGAILLLDTYGIYGADIYVLHNDICNRKLNLTMACLRACQLGLFPSATLKQACARQDRSGTSLVIPDALLLAVKKRLPKFDSQTVAA
jgi:hypothetical protein